MTPLMKKLVAVAEWPDQVRLEFLFGEQYSQFVNIQLMLYPPEINWMTPLVQVSAKSVGYDITIRIGTKWAEENLTTEEMSELVALRLKGDSK